MEIVLDRLSTLIFPYNWKLNNVMMGWDVATDPAEHDLRERLFAAALEVRWDHPFMD